MSIKSSPRPSVASSRAHSPTPNSSRRPSFENSLSFNAGLAIRSGIPPAPTRSVSPSHRRNRAALRDYYNLKSASSTPTGTTTGPGTPVTGTSAEFNTAPLPEGEDRNVDGSAGISHPIGPELDSSNFDAKAYINQLLATSSLSTVLKAENSLVGDIRTLDGERKALVYDNYSKLIRAVETIGKMRQSMEERGAPLTMTKTLGPAVGFVAETASALIREGEEQRRKIREVQSAAADEKTVERETVKWALSTPDRLRILLKEGKKEDAEKDWEEISGLLKKWEGVRGVVELRAACEEIMKQHDET